MCVPPFVPFRFSSSWASSCRKGAKSSCATLHTYCYIYIYIYIHTYTYTFTYTYTLIRSILLLNVSLFPASDSAVRGRVPAEGEHGSYHTFHIYFIYIEREREKRERVYCYGYDSVISVFSFCDFQIQQFVGEFLQKGSKEATVYSIPML